MSGILVFAVTFMVLLGVTLGFPALPPAETLYNFMGLPPIPIDMSIAGISGGLLVNGIINGVIWGALVLAVYALARRASRSEPLPPLPAPTHIPAPVPERTVRKAPLKSLTTRIAERRTYARLDKDIETIEGIGHTYGAKLRRSGVKTVADLLRQGSTRTGRRRLASKVDVAPATLLKWVSRADFFRIRGIGTQYSSLLESAGVDTVADLAMRDPDSLHVRLRRINLEKNLVRRTPPPKTVRGWVRSAKSLRPIVAY
jgi:predicted flap endonuclease-1-like 5' DNA nuclease